MTMRARRRLIRIGEITVRRTVAAPGRCAQASWRVAVFAQRRADAVARGAEIWSPAERSAMAEAMRRVG